MIDASQIKEQMEVKDSDGKHLGTVDTRTEIGCVEWWPRLLQSRPRALFR